jgi:hypothetical protein
MPEPSSVTPSALPHPVVGLSVDARESFTQTLLPLQASRQWQANQLCYWLLATAGDDLDAVLATLELTPHMYRKVCEAAAPQLEQMQLLHRAGRALNREKLATLLRCRINGMSMAAQTPADLAAVARTVRALPEWVWDEPGGKPAPQAATPAATPAAGGPASAAPQSAPAHYCPAPIFSAGLLPEEAPECGGKLLNRKQRRRLAAALRKG